MRGDPFTTARMKRFEKFLQGILFPHFESQEIITHILFIKFLGLISDLQRREDTVDHLFNL